MPKIRLGKLEVSRLILGSKPFFGFAHGNPHASAADMKAYYTRERIMAVLDAAAAQGITAVWTPCYDEWVALWNEYRAKGGKLSTWIGQPDRMPMEKEILTAVKNGAKAVCIQGMRIDDQVNAGKWETIRGWLELIQSHGLPAGMATHGAKTHLVAEEKGLPTDFYHQTMYRPDDYVRSGLDESLATIEKLEKPVVAYKALGAGRILPRDALPELLRRLKRKDGICIGMFRRDKDQIAEDAALMKELTRKGRSRPDARRDDERRLGDAVGDRLSFFPSLIGLLLQPLGWTVPRASEPAALRRELAFRASPAWLVPAAGLLGLVLPR